MSLLLVVLAGCSAPAPQAPVFDLQEGTELSFDAPPVDRAPAPGVLTLSSTPWLSTQVATITVSDAQPGDTVALLFTGTPGGPQTCPPVMAPDCLDITKPKMFGTELADVNGVATFNLILPDPMPPPPQVELQAVVLLAAGGADTSNTVVVDLWSLTSDADGDGLTLADELANGTDSLNADTDGGFVDDGTEVNVQGTDPLDPADDIVPVVETGDTGGGGGVEQITINEALSDPNGAGDANCDGIVGANDDKFVEIVNTGTVAVDLSGGLLLNSTLATVHIFPAGTVLEPMATVVVFGGGTPTFPAFTDPWCDPLPPDVTVQTSSAGNLSLNSTGDTVYLLDAAQTVIYDTFIYGFAATNQSMNRDPELDPASGVVEHTTIAGSGTPFSPGRRVDLTEIGLPVGSTSLPGELVVNEILGDLAVGDDANCDGTANAQQDAFFEIVNTGTTTVDMSGFEVLVDAISVHTFPGGTVLDPDDILVVFGGGTPTFADFMPEWCVPLPANVTVQTSTSGNLQLFGSGQMVILDPATNDVWQDYTWGTEAENNESIVRNPEMSFNPMIGHSALGGFPFSPGRAADMSELTDDGVPDDPPPIPTAIINEVLADLPTLGGDTNCDGINSGQDDKFVEIVNVDTNAVDLTGATLQHDNGTGSISTLHTFGAVLDPGDALVVFGGGTTGFGGILPPCNDRGANVQFEFATSGSLSLAGPGDTLWIIDANGTDIIEEVTWGSEGNANQSLHRDPDSDPVAPLVQHIGVSPTGASWSPAQHLDGSNF